MAEKKTERKIFEYLDYREFLRDYYQSKKNNNPAFSLRPDFRCRVEGLNRRSIFHDSIIGNKSSIHICYVNDSAEISGLKCSPCILLDNITDLRNYIACIYIQFGCNVAVHNLNIYRFAVINAV